MIEKNIIMFDKPLILKTLKKLGKWIIIIFIIFLFIISFEYCRKEFNKDFKSQLKWDMMFMKHKLKELKELDGQN